MATEEEKRNATTNNNLETIDFLRKKARLTR